MMAYLLITFCISFKLFFFDLASATTLRFIGDVNFPTEIQFKETLLGGLSGLIYEPATKKLFSVSDDPARKGPTRIYEFSIDLRENHFALVPEDVIFLTKHNQKKFKKGRTDFEDIIITSNNHFLIVTEKDGFKKQETPGIYEFTKSGQLINIWPVPQKYQNGPEQGIRKNLAFEALSITPDQKHIFIGMEGPLIQDALPPSFESGSLVRILHYQTEQKNNNLIAEYVYPIEAVPNPSNIKISVFMANGLVAMLALDENNFLMLERSYIASTNKNTIRLYLASKNNNTTNVLKMDKLPSNSIIPMTKKLLYDFDEALPYLNPNYAYLDNIEGMSWGPQLPNGNKSLIFVSDNNFRTQQRTLFMAFEFISTISTTDKKIKHSNL